MLILPFESSNVRKDYFFFLAEPPEAFLDALSGLTLVSSTLISTFTCEAKLQMPPTHFLAGAGYALQTWPMVPVTIRSHPSQFSSIT